MVELAVQGIQRCSKTVYPPGQTLLRTQAVCYMEDGQLGLHHQDVMLAASLQRQGHVKTHCLSTPRSARVKEVRPGKREVLTIHVQFSSPVLVLEETV